jgi:hypothetical protein
VTHKYCTYKFKTRVRLKLGKTNKNENRPWKLGAKANCCETPKKQQSIVDFVIRKDLQQECFQKM